MENEEQDARAGGVRMSDERARRGNDTPRRVRVSEPATAGSVERFFQNSFFVVVSAIGAVVVLVVFAMLFAALLSQNVDTDTLSAMLGTGTTVIGTWWVPLWGCGRVSRVGIVLRNGLSKV